MGRSTEYYRHNRRAAKKKQAYDAKLNAKPAQVQKRVEANRARRKARKRGQNIQGKDFDHAVNKFVSSRVNRGRRGEGGR